MTNATSPDEKENSRVAALLWSPHEGATIAPGWLGGETVEEQKRIVDEHAERDGRVIQTHHATRASLIQEPDGRLMPMLALVAAENVSHLYVPGGTFAREPVEVALAYEIALKLQGVELIICNE